MTTRSLLRATATAQRDVECDDGQGVRIEAAPDWQGVSVTVEVDCPSMSLGFNLTVEEARAVAQGLTEMADRAEKTFEEGRPHAK